MELTALQQIDRYQMSIGLCLYEHLQGSEMATAGLLSPGGLEAAMVLTEMHMDV